MKTRKKIIKAILLFSFIPLFMAFAACCSIPQHPSLLGHYSPKMEDGFEEESDAELGNAPQGRMLKEKSAEMTLNKAGGAEAAPSLPVQQEPSVQNRKRIYNASTGIVLDNPEKTRLEYETMAVEAGGYVESSYTDLVVLRVPVKEFNSVLEQVLASGRVEFSRVETMDVTEAYSDIERRLSTARQTRERLYVLLEKSKKPEERARILREIGRLTEEIENLKQQISLMDSRVAFSTISIQLIPRIGGELTRSDIPFRWIASLDPTTPAGWKLKGRVTLNLDDDWAVFSREDTFTAENSQRETVMISTVENTPRGDNTFWQNALEHHLKPFYASLEKKNLEEWGVYGVELVSKDQYPFRYFVGVKADKGNLHVVEIFSPDSAKGFESIYAAFEGGGIK